MRFRKDAIPAAVRTVLLIICFMYLMNIPVLLPSPFISNVSSPFYLFLFSARFVFVPAMLLVIFFTKAEIYERLSYLKGLRASHAATFFLGSAAFLWLSGLDQIPKALTYLSVAALAEQFVFAVLFSVLAFQRHRFFLALIMTILFIYIHGLTFDPKLVPGLIALLPTVYRTIVDKNLWWGTVYHFLWNWGVYTILKVANQEAATDAQLYAVLVWFLAMVGGWILLIWPPAKMKHSAAAFISRLRARLGRAAQ